jgi:hypothetical protein
MWKNVYFWLWIHQKGMTSLHMEMEKRPFVQDSDGGENLSITNLEESISYVSYLFMVFENKSLPL